MFQSFGHVKCGGCGLSGTLAGLNSRKSSQFSQLQWDYQVSGGNYYWLENCTLTRAAYPIPIMVIWRGWGKINIREEFLGFKLWPERIFEAAIASHLYHMYIVLSVTITIARIICFLYPFLHIFPTDSSFLRWFKFIFLCRYFTHLLTCPHQR